MYDDNKLGFRTGDETDDNRRIAQKLLKTGRGESCVVVYDVLIFLEKCKLLWGKGRGF